MALTQLGFRQVLNLAGGMLACVLIVLRRMKVSSTKPWAMRLLSPEEGAPSKEWLEEAWASRSSFRGNAKH